MKKDSVYLFFARPKLSIKSKRRKWRGWGQWGQRSFSIVKITVNSQMVSLSPRYVFRAVDVFNSLFNFATRLTKVTKTGADLLIWILLLCNFVFDQKISYLMCFSQNSKGWWQFLRRDHDINLLILRTKFRMLLCLLPVIRAALIDM